MLAIWIIVTACVCLSVGVWVGVCVGLRMATHSVRSQVLALSPQVARPACAREVHRTPVPESGLDRLNPGLMPFARAFNPD